MKHLKEQLQFFDLYDFETTMIILKLNFSQVSNTEKSVPTEGSKTRSSIYVNEKAKNISIEKLIFHRDDKITVKTNVGYFQFWSLLNKKQVKERRVFLGYC